MPHPGSPGPGVDRTRFRITTLVQIDGADLGIREHEADAAGLTAVTAATAVGRELQVCGSLLAACRLESVGTEWRLGPAPAVPHAIAS